MIYYKKFKHENTSDSIYNYLGKNKLVYNNEFFYNTINFRDFFINFPEIKIFLNSLKTNCIGIGLIKIFYNKVAIHQDNSASNGGTIRLNWPILNCEHSDTIFYENFNNVKHKKFLDNGIIFHEYDDKDCREIDRFSLDVPTAIDVSVPHRVICEKFPRISLTFHLRPNPTWLLT